MTRRIVAMVGCAALAPVACANGAMGYGFERYQFLPWAVYCVVMVALEAWLIGRWLGLRWWDAAIASVVANTFTAFVIPSILIAPVLHGPVGGSVLDPRPFPGEVLAITVLTLF